MRGRWIQSGAIGINWCYCVGVIRAKGKLTQKKRREIPQSHTSPSQLSLISDKTIAVNIEWVL